VADLHTGQNKNNVAGINVKEFAAIAVILSVSGQVE